ncbi:MAG: YabP/YqfC family sporulation protein [Bacilli bacterium]|nr:YabP/YqfC family sporulation protein [Bacilli bacterium]
MFEYNNFILKVMGFLKVISVDENKVLLLYKNKSLLINGEELVVSNLIDNSLEISGVINEIKMEYFND